MELKDVILSTLAEMEDDTTEVVQENIVSANREEYVPVQAVAETVSVDSEPSNALDSELVYLNSIRERLLVLFEGFQAPNNSNIEAKVDMTLNFLEYTLATIDKRVEKIEKGSLN